jgi:hypothetical protein
MLLKGTPNARLIVTGQGIHGWVTLRDDANLEGLYESYRDRTNTSDIHTAETPLSEDPMVIHGFKGAAYLMYAIRSGHIAEQKIERRDVKFPTLCSACDAIE